MAEVSTAIPAFIGCTGKGPQVARITTLLEYLDLFGGAKPTGFKVHTSEDANSGLPVVDRVEATDATNGQPAFLMYYCMSHYFKNGGGPCYVIPTGDYSEAPQKVGFIKALELLEKEDEPTLIVLTDAVKLEAADYHEVCQTALAQCRKLRDRFAIFDVRAGDAQAFRDGIGTNALMYGAAYYPYLLTTLNFRYREEDVQIQSAAAAEDSANWEKDFGANTIVVRYTGTPGATPKVKIIAGDSAVALDFAVTADLLTVSNVSGRAGSDVAAAWATWAESNDAAGFAIAVSGDGSGHVQHTSNTNVDLDLQPGSGQSDKLDSLKEGQTALYNLVKAELGKQRVALPPSAAMAGIYARVDRQRGVWKAPANVSVSAVIGPVSKTTHEAQAALNVDPTAGKSINAIRAFTGKGTLVWGSRTLAGNDNEWRYVPVRRLFILIEESIQKSTGFAVFEPNDATTWLKVKGMIESYLYGLWERGALAGPTPESAYFVNVGLGKTMTAQDILEGRMIVEVGVAAVRPAEFIILRFTHKMQEA
ncbi:MAG: phage tail sheath subtilisin-like domain-containing protein [Chromatiales bacterium]|nr:phage tail sheath subtilisin-like domain-containing protein [Chromatiales bacterium]